jgi:hypothetical protein
MRGLKVWLDRVVLTYLLYWNGIMPFLFLCSVFLRGAGRLERSIRCAGKRWLGLTGETGGGRRGGWSGKWGFCMDELCVYVSDSCMFELHKTRPG